MTTRAATESAVVQELASRYQAGTLDRRDVVRALGALGIAAAIGPVVGVVGGLVTGIGFLLSP
ncbi:MAG: hypothetical protein H0U40_02865, partial [Chloroflexia bacterium]|nr:hypothetical protein [Chloroflexia bacterium]